MQRTPASDDHKIRASAPIREVHKIEGREWWLWGFAVTVTIVLTIGIVALTIPASPLLDQDWFDLKEWVRGLAGLVLIFDIYTVYQHWQLHKIRRHLVEQDQLFRLISENAADMIVTTVASTAAECASTCRAVSTPHQKIAAKANTR